MILMMAETLQHVVQRRSLCLIRLQLDSDTRVTVA